MAGKTAEIVTEYDGLQVYKVSDGNAWIRTVAANHIDALVFALKEDSGEYWGQECFETEAHFSVEMDAETELLTIAGMPSVLSLALDNESTKTAAQWADENGEGVLSVSEY